MTDNTSYLRRGALTLAVVTVGGFLASYGFDVGLARFLSPVDYGDFKVAYAFATFFGLAVLLGGDRAAPMVLAPVLERGETRKVWEYLRFYLLCSAALGGLLAALTWAGCFLHVGSFHPGHHHPLAWVVLAVPLNAAAAMISRTLQAARRPAEAAFPWRIGMPVLQLAFFALVVAFGDRLGVVEAIVLSMAATAAITVGQWLRVRSLGLVELARAPAFSESRGWLGASLPMMGTFLVAVALGQSDLYFLEALGDEAEVGRYAAGSVAAHFVVLVQTTVIGVVAPLARPAIEAGREASRAAFRQAHLLLLGGAVPVAIGLAAAAGPVLSLFGPEYGEARPILLLLTAGNLAWAGAAVSSLWLQYQGRAGAVLGVSIACLVLDSGLNLVLIPRYGMAGAAAGTAFTLTAAAVAVVLLCRRLHREGR